MSDSIAKRTMREIKPLDAEDPVIRAARRVHEAGLPALPAVERDGTFAGIFGEREFIAALFPGYLAELRSARMVTPSMDVAIDRRIDCAHEPVRLYLTPGGVVVGDEYSDTQIAELFIHHRVLIVPIATRGHIHAVITRHAFFETLLRQLSAQG